MPIKQTKRSKSNIARSFKTPSWKSYAMAGAGMMAAYGTTKFFANPGASVEAPQGENPFSAQSFKEAGYFQRMSRLAALGMAQPSGGGGVAAGVAGAGNALQMIGTYHVEKAKDLWATTVGGQTGLSDSFMSGAMYGGAAGAGVGLMSSIASWGRVPLKKAVPILGLLGAVAGGYGARKVNLDIVRSVNEAKKNALNKRRMSNRGRTVGPGFKSWTSGSRRIGRPGHLGMDGSTPFAMHKARHRSTV
tara:strand:- start:213 stop:953 length:741 start_codon:yes stop_codon:yes gene_type:complete